MYDEEKIHEFLRESNAIENEFSDEAFEDALAAWACAYEQHAKPNETFLFTEELMLEIHKRLMHRLRPDIAGKFRTCNVRVGIQLCPPYERISRLVSHWCYHINSLANSITAPRQLHIEFEQIHPFEDGNGRVGRILYNIHRLQCGMRISIIKDSEKEAYYRWFR